MGGASLGYDIRSCLHRGERSVISRIPLVMQKLPDLLHHLCFCCLIAPAVGSLPAAIMRIIVAPDNMKVFICSAHSMNAGRCRSCQWITQSVNEQLSAKTADLPSSLLAGSLNSGARRLEFPEQHFRNKAKMVVAVAEKPLFGMLHRDGCRRSISGRPLHPASPPPVFSAR